MVRSEVVHIGWLQVDASSYRFAAVLGGSPSEGHCMVHRPCATVECSCIAFSLADSRRSRSEPVHVDGTRVDASNLVRMCPLPACEDPLWSSPFQAWTLQHAMSDEAFFHLIGPRSARDRKQHCMGLAHPELGVTAL